ncbi:hypothetical protein U27_06047 [Candidatus Vecturithrix granuli]|uniref:Uncharacterized protein n=1 Tax=Vecturithrix granuli TaxID=1499967 RepID=A0A081C3B6_VECG1|nr:hypothetical protein U27_06047 [Candidatus Vecturithrix granuli]
MFNKMLHCFNKEFHFLSSFFMEKIDINSYCSGIEVFTNRPWQTCRTSLSCPTKPLLSEFFHLKGNYELVSY